MQNIIAARFEAESEGYQAITTLSKASAMETYTILEMALIRNEEGNLKVLDTFSTGVHTTDDTLRGGLLGSFLGILGGPVGVLLGGSAGAAAGSIFDAEDSRNSASMIEKAASKMCDGDVALVILAEEADEAVMDAELNRFNTEIIRFDAAVIAAEVEEAEEMEAEMQRLARIRLREAKKEEYKNRIEEKRAKISADFETFKAKFK